MSQNIDILIQTNDQASKAIKAVNSEIGKLKEGVGDAGKKMSTFGDTFKAIAAYDIGKNIAVSLFDIGKKAVGLASNLEQTRIAFTTMTGDARIADAFIREMTDFAKTTPFEIGNLETASKQLLAYGFEVQNVIPTMKMMGDISAGVGMEKLPNLIMALGQVKAATRLTGNEMRQFTEAGVPLLGELAKTMHLSVAEVQDMVTKGQVGYPMVEKALASLTGEGGRFANLMDKQSKSFGGMISNFQDTITIMLRDLGGEFLPGMKKILADMLTFWDNNGKMMSVSFTGFVKEIFTFFSEGFSGIASIFEMVSSFFVSTNTDTTDQLAFSWKNIFLYLDIGLKATALIFKTVGAYIAYQMVNASYSAQIAFANLKNAFSIIGLGIMATAGFIGQNIAAGITKGISLAIKGLNWLIDSLNNIPGLDIKKIGDSFKEVETINFKQASQMAGQIMGVHADLMDGVKSLEAEKAQALQDISASTKDMIVADANKMSDAYLNFTNAQKTSAQSGKTLAQVLAEIGKKQAEIASGGGAGGPGDKKAGEAQKKALDELKALGKETASSLESIFGGLNTKVDGSKSKLMSMSEEYKKLKDTLKKVGEEGVKALDDIQKKMDEQAGKIRGITGEGQIDIAKRLIEAQKELQDIKDKQMKGEGITGEELQKRFALEKEIALGESKTTGAERQKAIEESQKSEIQLILDKTAKKVLEAEAERLEIQKTYDAKKASIEKEKADITLQITQKKAEMVTEFSLYQQLLTQRKVIEEQYFSVFQKNIKLQMDKTREAITLIQTLNSKTGGNNAGLDGAKANGGPVIGGGSYLVGERGPEIFTPGRSGNITPNNAIGGNTINVNLGGVSVRNDRDIQAITDSVLDALTRKTQLWKQGIA